MKYVLGSFYNINSCFLLTVAATNQELCAGQVDMLVNRHQHCTHKVTKPLLLKACYPHIMFNCFNTPSEAS